MSHIEKAKELRAIVTPHYSSKFWCRDEDGQCLWRDYWRLNGFRIIWR